MMSLEMVVEMVEALGQDAFYDVYEDEDGVEVSVSIYDFEGFDEDWSEVFRDYDEEAVDHFEEVLEHECVSYEPDCVVCYYHFEGFDVSVRYSSSDI